MGSQRQVKPSMGRDRAIVSLETAMHSLYLSSQDSHWQQFDTTCSFISAPSGTIWTALNLQGQKNAACEKHIWLSLALSLVCLDSARVCSFHVIDKL